MKSILNIFIIEEGDNKAFAMADFKKYMIKIVAIFSYYLTRKIIGGLLKIIGNRRYFTVLSQRLLKVYAWLVALILDLLQKMERLIILIMKLVLLVKAQVIKLY